MRYLLIGIALLAMTCAFADVVSATAPVNLTVQQYVFAAWAGNVPDAGTWNHALYTADPLNDGKTGFNVTVDGHGGSGTDTANVAWISNCPAQIKFDWNKGDLPGVWTMKFDGPLCPPVSPPGATYVTEAADINVKIIAPLKLTVEGIDYTTLSKSYSGSVTFTTIPASH